MFSAVSSCASSPLASPTLSGTSTAILHESSIRRRSFGTPSAYVSDEDLYGDFGDEDLPYLNVAPPPPRPAEAYLARPLLPPVTKPSRRSSSCHQKTGKGHKLAFKG
ncbi:hypothetical protein LTR53_015793 [Teratosphaeriaceae sp. CCFEE 6253]|nr:hypothetical protein LTR53_015793 [Teratosphaeriaceae sp. CCFEE 6253]